MEFFRQVMIKGAGDLATGVAHRLWMSGFSVMMLELPKPFAVRRTVAFASAVFCGEIEIEGVKAKLCKEPGEEIAFLEQNIIPVFVDPEGRQRYRIGPDIFIDAIMAKRNTGTSLEDAPIVIGLGPGFIAGKDVHAVVETKRGFELGKVLYSGSAVENTGLPGMIAGYSKERLLKAPVAGVFVPEKEIGQLVQRGDVVATVEGVPVIAEINGVIRGMLSKGLEVKKGFKIGDIDPRGKDIDCGNISDKARAVAGGVLEAILHFQWRKRHEVFLLSLCLNMHSDSG